MPLIVQARLSETPTVGSGLQLPITVRSCRLGPTQDQVEVILIYQTGETISLDGTEEIAST